jgi:hypothetical protein
VREANPLAYFKGLLSLLPKRVSLETQTEQTFSDDLPETRALLERSRRESEAQDAALVKNRSETSVRRSRPDNRQDWPEGSRNKPTQAVTDLLEAIGCDPIKGMARIAMDQSVNLSIRAQAFSELSASSHPSVKQSRCNPRSICRG